MDLLVVLLVQIVWVYYMKSEYFGKWDTCRWVGLVLFGSAVWTVVVIFGLASFEILSSTPEAGPAIAQLATDRIVAHVSHEIGWAFLIDIPGMLAGCVAARNDRGNRP